MSDEARPGPGTFRDPAGYLVLSDQEVLRHVRPAYDDEAREFLNSGLRGKLEKSGELSTSEIVPSDEGLCLRHPLVWFTTYPWEWTVGQWRAAADLTLRLQDEALRAGWTLKDATPLNILFEGTKPILVDVLSFAKRDPQSPVWLAYGQFVRTMLLPLVAHRWLRWPLAATSSRRDGFEPHEIYDALPWLRRLHPRLLWPVTLPVMLERRVDDSGTAKKAQAVHRDPAIAKQVLLHTVAGLRKQVGRAAPEMEKSAWSQYEQTAEHYTAAEVEQKRRFVEAGLTTAAAGAVLDIGANTGTYSLLAAAHKTNGRGARVVALEGDPSAAERIYHRAVAAKADIQPVVANLAWPTPAYGWENAETKSLLSRMEKKFDLVLMLAVVHHLLLREQIPLDRIAALAARLTKKWLLLEWVPVQDPMFQKLLRGRDELYGGIDEAQWEQAVAPHFELVEREELSNQRVMLLYRLKGAS
jgi:SAM-dependent methyltransferase